MPLDRQRAVLLIRVSDIRQEREGLSLDNQEQTLRAYAQERQFVIDREFRFQETADLKIRRNFQEMVNYVKSRKDVTEIVGYRVDRLTRNYHDHVLLDELRLNHGKELHFVHDRLVINRQSVGRDISEWDTKVYLAKSYLNRLKEDARTTIKYKLSRGEWPGKAPYGYLNTRRNGRGWIEACERTAPIAEQVLRLYASGAHSMQQVRELIRSEFGVELAHGRVDHILKNPFYTGWMRFEGNLYRHAYTPLIPQNIFNKILEVKASHKKVKYKFAGLEFPYRGLVVCGHCGCRVTCERKRKGGRTYHYYHCTQFFGKHRAAYVSEREMNAQFDALLKGITIPTKWATAIEQILVGSKAQSQEQIESRRKTLTAERRRMQTRLETLYDDRLDGVLSFENYQSRREKTEQSIQAIDRQLDELAISQTEPNSMAISVVRFCSKVRQAFERSKASEKREILKLILSNCELHGKRLVWKLNKPFDTVFIHGDRHIWLHLADAFRNDVGDFEVTGDQVNQLLSVITNDDQFRDPLQPEELHPLN